MYYFTDIVDVQLSLVNLLSKVLKLSNLNISSDCSYVLCPRKTKHVVSTELEHYTCKYFTGWDFSAQ